MAERIQAIDLRASADRVPLPTVAGRLSAPFSLYIEPTSLCNMRCQFCPTGHRHLRNMRPNGLMTWEVWKDVVSGIAAFGLPLKKANLYKDGDPLVHPQFPEMVRHMADARVSESIWTKTNGLALKPELNERLAACGLDMIGISIQHVTAEGYQRIARVRLDYDKFLSNLDDLYRRTRSTGTKLYIKIADSGLTKAEIEKFFADHMHHADCISVEKLHGWSNSDVMDFQLGTRPDTFEGYPLTDKIVCPLPFFMLAVNWNGTVSTCNEDFSHQCIVGDLRTQTLKEVWDGPALRRFRRMHLEGRRDENVNCRNCHYMTTLPDNIDAHRAEVLARLDYQEHGG